MNLFKWDYYKGSAMTTACVHHWVIDEASGGGSEGICKKCHCIKVFYNSIPDTKQLYNRGSKLNKEKKE